MFPLSLILLCVGAGASSISQYPTVDKPLYSVEFAEDHFNDFIVQFDKTYIDENEKQMRLEIFKQTLHKINARNSDLDETAVFDIAEYADLTIEEFAKRYTGGNVSFAIDDIPVIEVEGPVTMQLPENFDWREHNAVTEVKQQKCGDCWTFATAGVLEGAYARKYKKLVDFSEQQLIDCDKYDGGCWGGGLVSTALKYVKDFGGAELSYSYPYAEGHQGVCNFDQSKVTARVEKINKWSITDEDQLRQILVTSGPVGLNIYSKDLKGHISHIVSKCDPDPAKLDHLVLLVGYGTENGIPYWTIKNSWGTTFGENGYVKLRRGLNLCGLMNPEIVTVTVA